ncbi:MAG: shikimate kinase [Hyphomicrobiaceae bacterium]
MPSGVTYNASPQRTQPDVSAIRAGLGARSIVLVGPMGAGKSSIGRRLAQQLDLRFCDADTEIERAAGKSITEIFEEHGEPAFRSGEARVIERLLNDGPQVLATGGGAFMNERTRELVAKQGVSIWLNADLDLLVRRVQRRNNRPLLQGKDPEKVLSELLELRNPTYALADISVHSRDVRHEVTVSEILVALDNRF